MPPPRKTDGAFMTMMEKFVESHLPCDCSQCKRSAKQNRRCMPQPPTKDRNKENKSPTNEKTHTDHERHLCSEHRPPPPPRKSMYKDKDKDMADANNANQLNRNDKINNLLKADTVQAVLEVFRATPSTADEKQLSQDLQDATAQCKLFAESKARIIEYCNDDNVDLDAVFGLLAKFRQERSILTSAMIKSNSERERSLSAIHKCNDLMYMLKDMSRDGKGPSSEELRNSLGNMMFEIHELAKNPSTLYDELIELREEHLDLLADHEEQHQKFLDMESCHEKLHDDKKRLQEDIAAEKRDHLETKKRLSAMHGTQNKVNQAHKSLEKVHEDNDALKKEVEKLNAELAKINALKHENSQLKKKLATSEAALAAAVLPPVEVVPEPAPTSKKKKGKKGATSESPAPEASESKPSPHEKELKALQQANAEIQSQLDTVQTSLRQLEALLKKAEVAKTKALERQQIEQATAQNWKELSEGHSDESGRLREQLEESVSNAASLQNEVHRLEQALAEVRDQLKAQTQKRTSSPSISQTSSTSKLDNESLKVLRKLRAETAQLVQDLDSAKTYPGDPWNLVECARNMVAAIDHDLEGMLRPFSDTESANPVPDAYTSFTRGDHGIPTPVSIPRFREATPPLTSSRPHNLPAYRPLLPPGLAESNMGRASPKPTHLPSPIGTGRPTKNVNGLTPSPTQAPAKTVVASPPISNIGNGAAGVDWSIWMKR